MMGNLDSLFKIWKEKQKNEEDEKYEKSRPVCPCCGRKPGDEFKESFCYDGFLGDEDNVQILFICRESNVTDDIDKGGEKKDRFWMRKVVEKGGKGEKYKNCLQLLAKYVSQNEMIELKNCAYMNINKRGGFSSCTLEQLGNYAENYKEEIIKEIEIINPKKIVILGKLPKNFPKEIVECITKNREVYQYNIHPSRYRRDKEDKDMIRKSDVIDFLK